MYYDTQNEGFDEQYHCFSTAFAEKPELEEGDKILLPSSAFEQLAAMNIEYPMLFELRSANGKTHCSVLEFTATEGTCYIPFWMMQNLVLEEGELLCVKNVSLPKATFVKLKPLSADFLNISNTRAVLEKQLRRFSCVTVGDQICLPYNNKKYYIQVQDVKPSNAACIIECDCNVDFDEPQGYIDPTSCFTSKTQENNIPDVQKALTKYKDICQNNEQFKPFVHNGNRLNTSNTSSSNTFMSNTLKKYALKQPKNTKWGKSNTASFTGNGHSLK